MNDEETNELISQLESDPDVETVKKVTDRSIGGIALVTLALKVVETSIPVIQKLHQTLKKTKKETSLEFTLGDPNKKISIKGTMSPEEVAAIIKSVSG